MADRVCRRENDRREEALAVLLGRPGVAEARELLLLVELPVLSELTRGVVLQVEVLETEEEVLGLGLMEEEALGLAESKGLSEAHALAVALLLLARVAAADPLPVMVALGVRKALAVACPEAELSEAVPLPVLLPPTELVGETVPVLVATNTDLRALALKEGLEVLLGEKEGEEEEKGVALEVRLTGETGAR